MITASEAKEISEGLRKAKFQLEMIETIIIANAKLGLTWCNLFEELLPEVKDILEAIGYKIEATNVKSNGNCIFSSTRIEW
jgi:hypothetical protein